MGSYLYIWAIVGVLNGTPLMSWQQQGDYANVAACENAAKELGIPRFVRNSKDGMPEGTAYRCVSKNGR